MAQLVHRTGAGLPNKPIFSSTRFCSSLAYGDLASLLSPDNPLLDISAQEYLTLQRFCHQNSLKYSHIAHTNISPQYLTQISHPPKVFSSEFFEKFSPHQNLTPICHQYISQIPHPPKVFSVFFDIFSHSSHQYLTPISHQYLTQISHPPKVLSSDFFEMFSPHQKMHLIIDQVCQREDSPSTLQEVCTFKSPFPPAKLPKKNSHQKILRPSTAYPNTLHLHIPSFSNHQPHHYPRPSHRHPHHPHHQPPWNINCPCQHIVPTKRCSCT